MLLSNLKVDSFSFSVSAHSLYMLAVFSCIECLCVCAFMCLVSYRYIKYDGEMFVTYQNQLE